MIDQCMFYRWNAGYYCDLKYNKEGNGDISEYEVNHYCWYGRFENCPLYKNRSGSGGCYLTSACVDAMGMADDCHELTVLRTFRDGYLSKQDGGKEEICEYYQIAPQIVDGIRESPNSDKALARIYEQLVEPCVKLIEHGECEVAHRLYRSYTRTLKENYGQRVHSNKGEK